MMLEPSAVCSEQGGFCWVSVCSTDLVRGCATAKQRPRLSLQDALLLSAPWVRAEPEQEALLGRLWCLPILVGVACG